MPELGAIIGHSICRSRDVMVLWDIAVLLLVQCLIAKEVCGGTGSGGRAFSLPIDIGRVIRACPDRSFAHIRKLDNDIVVRDIATQFKVTVGY